MQIVAPKLNGILKTGRCSFAILGFAALCFAPPCCFAEAKGSPAVPEWVPMGLIALLFGLLILARRRVLRLVVQAREGELAVRQRIESLEHENAELLRTQEEMRHHAEHDGLTGLLNHRMILERLRQEVDRSRRGDAPLTVIMVDLDEFKNVNDTFGHQAGDLVLKEVSAIFQTKVRSYDWVGRYGGDEFLLILPGSSFVHTRIRSEQFRLAVQAARIKYGESVIQITASFGAVSGFPADSESMLLAADAALYRAKANGCNCVTAAEVQPAARLAEPY